MEIQAPEQKPEEEKVYYGTLVIFMRYIEDVPHYLVVENTKTGNVTFLGGAQEDIDPNEEATAKREILEELGLASDRYTLEPMNVKHEFVFGSNKAERAGRKGSYQVFIGHLAEDQEIGHTDELKSAHWMTREETLEKLSFPDLKEVFERTLQDRS